MSVATKRKMKTEAESQMSFDFSAIMREAVQKPSRRKSDLDDGIFIEANLLESSSFDLGVKTTSLLVGESSTDVKLEQAESQFLNNNGYVFFALEALYLAASDLLILENVGGRENATEDQLYTYSTALLWLDGEPSVFSFKDCVKLLDYELRFQSADNGTIPDIAGNPQVIRNWIRNDPKEAVSYLRSYQTLFGNSRRAGAKKEESYNQLLESANASNNNPSSLTSKSYICDSTREVKEKKLESDSNERHTFIKGQQYERPTP